MSLHILWNAQSAIPIYSARGEIDDLTARTPCAWCIRSAFRVTTSLSSVRSLRFGRWHDRNEKIRSSPSRCRLHAASLCSAFAISRRRFRGRISPVLVTAAGKKRRRIKRAIRFSTTFGFRRDWNIVGQRLCHGKSFNRKGYGGLFLLLSQTLSSRKSS